MSPLSILSQIHIFLVKTLENFPWPTYVHHLKLIPIERVTNLDMVLANTDIAPMHTCLATIELVCNCISFLPQTLLLFYHVEHLQFWPISTG
jgi:hypothetical protein